MTIRKDDYCFNVVDLFKKQVHQRPEFIAISDEHHSLTYNLLNEKSNQIAYWLQQQGVNAGDFVGILLDPGVDMVISVLAILKIGGIYLPLDTQAPSQRLAEILDDALPALVITNEQYFSNLNKKSQNVRLIKNMHLETAAFLKTQPTCHLSSDSALCLMYTSGSTGKPKGVLIPHQAVINLSVIENTLQIKEREVIAQFSNLAFDGFTFELWSALLNGARLVIASIEARKDHRLLKKFIENNHVKYLFLPTGYFHQLIKSAIDTLNEVSTVLFGGEQVNVTLLKTFILYRKKNKLPIVLINGYGPTETTAYTCYQKISEQQDVDDFYLSSIGQPIKNARTYILDENMLPVTEGELYVSGINLALGYYRCEIENKNKFLRNPFGHELPFQRLYKTGDKVRLLDSGDLLFLGRLDDQVKVGGFRIHLSEIERHLMNHPSITLAAVVVDTGGGLHQMLTAYIVPLVDTEINADDIRVFLARLLPSYMLPTKYILVDEFPLNLVGKVDKTKLATHAQMDLSCHADIISESHTEESIKAIWQHLLGVPAIDVHKNLFEAGANSLLITEACTRINEQLGCDVYVSDIFTYPTIHKVSRYIDGDIESVNVRERKNESTDDIAIIGMACRLPASDNLEEYWDNLCDGKECLTRFSEDELIANDQGKHVLNQHFVPVKGVLSNIEAFDAGFFGFNPVDASITDPQHRVFLECAWEALEHAAVAPEKMNKDIISVFAGMSDSSYERENLLKNSWFGKEHDRFQQRIAVSSSMLSTQVSYRLNLRGRSVNVNTACSTGLVTVSQACQELKSGKSDIALAGAVSISVPQINGYFYQNGSIESPDGVCRPFSSDANGTVFSNGVGVVVLKRLQDAVNDKDTIYAVIKGAGINNDGSDKLGFMAPSTNGQINCIREALTEAGISGESVGFIEAHGTATALGDVVEMDALKAVYGSELKEKQSCALGSVKGNIGHTDAAAGIAGLIKTVLCLYHQKIPATVHFIKPNPALSLEESPFFINQQLIDWERRDIPRYAGVSSFGVGGTNAHIILEEYCVDPLATVEPKEQLFILSAKTEQALVQNTHRLITHVCHASQSGKMLSLSDVAYTLQTGREDFQWRRFGVAKTVDEFNAQLHQNKVILHTDDRNHFMVFMFPGQGMQYHEMAAQLMDAIPFFNAMVLEGVRIAQQYLQVDLLEIVKNPQDTRLNQTQYAQPALFIIEYALARYLMEIGVKPTALIGHSIGEYVAACLAGVFSFSDGIALVCERGLLMSSAPAGEMLSIECTALEFAEFQQHANVELALHNGLNHCVSSGDREETMRLEQYLAKGSVPYHKLKVNHAFHSRSMESIAESFKGLFSNITLSAPLIPIVSNVTGNWLSAQDAVDPDYWYRHLRLTVKLSDGLRLLAHYEHSIFMEVGPGRSLSTFLKNVIGTQPHHGVVLQTLPTQNRPTSDLYQLLSAIGGLWQEGVKIDWSLIHHQKIPCRIALPTYAFQKQRYWVEPDGHAQHVDEKPALYKPVWTHYPAYIELKDIGDEELVKHDWIVFKDSLGYANDIILALEQHHIVPVIVEAGTDFVEMSPVHFKINPADKTHYALVFKSLKNRLCNPIFLHFYSCENLNKGILSADEIDKQLILGFYSVLYFTQSYIEEVGDKIPFKCSVTTFGTQLANGLEHISPVNASLIGACRVISEEHPQLEFKLVDISLEESSQLKRNRACHMINDCVNNNWQGLHPIVAYRGGHQWDVSHMEIKTPETEMPFKNDGVYLLTGGLGGLTLSLCEAISNAVTNPRFILLSRRLIPMELHWDDILSDSKHPLFEKITQLKKLKASGATLYIHQVDITQTDELSSVINHYRHFLGCINGVVHGAGIPGGGLVQFKSKQTADSVFMPKIYGTYCLAKALQNLTLDFVVLLSSLVVLKGEAGQIDYTAANACLDACAVSSLFSAKHVLSLNWNTWRDVGMAADALCTDGVSFFDRGNDISPSEGRDLFVRAMRQNYSNIAVSNDDLSISTPQQKNIKSDRSFVKVSREHIDTSQAYCPPSSHVQKELARLFQDALGIDSVGMHDDFFTLGGHSLKALRLIDIINKQFNSNLTIHHLYKTPTIGQLSEIVESGSVGAQDIVVPLKIIENKSPYIFLCHPASGMIYCFNSFAVQRDLTCSIYGLQDPSVSEGKMVYDSIFSMAESYLSAIKSVQPRGPYYLVGYSFGATVMYEVANKLQEQKEDVGLLALIEGWSIFSSKQKHMTHFKKQFHSAHPDLTENMIDLAWARMELLLNHTPTQVNHDMVLFKATELLDDYIEVDDTLNGWSKFNGGKIICHRLDANHETIMNVENSQKIMGLIQNIIFRNG
ncbi:MAG TPA: non-ribosomal peptide synthetase/polyketide synthase [Legionella sp.]|nr:non-ribosomal peptide synthetase/polyketide synthase [Legionella sp.]